MPKPQKGGRDRGGGGGHLSRKVTISKALSLILRHAAEREGLKMNSQGYANVADVLAWRKLKSLQVTFPEILDAVENSDKKRFALLHIPSAESSPPQNDDGSTPKLLDSEESTPAAPTPLETTTAIALAAASSDLNPDNYLIRATQGHSIKTVEAESLLEKITLGEANTTTPLPETVVHGTFHGAWPQILDSGGLRCMGRNHVHFATGPSLESVLAGTAPVTSGKDKTVISGMRHDAQVLIYIDIRKALEAGCPFWRSENGVILSEGMEVEGQEDRGKVVPLEFFDVVVERKQGLGKIWEKGEVLQTLPLGLTSKGTPKGKRGGGGGAAGDWKLNKQRPNPELSTSGV